MQPQLLTVIKEEKLKTWAPDEWSQWRLEPKLDGYRLTYHKGQFLSRTGKPLHNLEHIAAELSDLPGWTFDGELHGDKWEDAAAARRSKNGEVNDLKFTVFDMLEDEDWISQTCAETFAYRRLRLCSMIHGRLVGMKYVTVVPQHKVTSYEDFALLHAANLAEGCDGTVLKRLDSLYEFKRVKTWLKVKPVETYDCIVVGSKEGTGKYAGMLGAMEILVSAGVTCFCSGMTDEQRQAWWAEPDLIAGKTIEVSARGVHPSGRLIEPRFIRIRGDK